MKTPKFAFATNGLKSVFAILILVFVLNFDTIAQYELLIRGQATSFDSAVAVRLDRYREESEKLKLGQQLVDSLGQEVQSLARENSLQALTINSNNFTISEQSRALHRKDSVVSQMNTYFERLHEIAANEEKELKILKYTAVGVIAFEIVRLFVK